MLSKNRVAIAQMSLQEVNIAIGWARQEGWNPGIHDAECFYCADPTGFYVAKINGETVGTISIVKYSKDFAFTGFFIVHPEMRRKGIGKTLYRFFEDSSKGFNVGIDGVLQSQLTYEQHGFKFSHRNCRYQVTANAKLSDKCIPIREKNFSEILAFDARCFSVPRSEFLRCWLFQNDSHAFMIQKRGTNEIRGYGVIRKCSQGNKIGPLFADCQETAARILESLMSTVPGEKVFLDVPEPNLLAVTLAQKYNMQPVFATVRMYTKHLLALPLHSIYGITSFELG